MKKSFLIVISFLFTPTILLAQISNTIVPQNCLDKECKFVDLIILVNNIGAWSMVFVTSVATVMFVYAGFLYVTAQGDSGQVKNATGIFRNVAIGFVIILASYMLIKELLIKLTVDQGLINLIK